MSSILEKYPKLNYADITRTSKTIKLAFVRSQDDNSFVLSENVSPQIALFGGGFYLIEQVHSWTTLPKDVFSSMQFSQDAASNPIDRFPNFQLKTSGGNKLINSDRIPFGTDKILELDFDFLARQNKSAQLELLIDNQNPFFQSPESVAYGVKAFAIGVTFKISSVQIKDWISLYGTNGSQNIKGSRMSSYGDHMGGICG